MASERPATVGKLRASGWVSKPVRTELRNNAINRLKNNDSIINDVLGFDQTVLPQLANALVAGHDIIFLGERGQAKTRIIRALTSLLDEWLPIIAGSEINDDPFNPISAHAKAQINKHGDQTPITWIHRDDRFGEKLATPDTSIADLIGEVDPIKVAEGRYLADELTLHYGLVPRTNRGIFAINELPDLAERIQVGLLNVLEERDVQIRGHKVRLPLDVMLVASANPEDYTNRGRIITPLKDRFGAQIRTHYPPDIATEAQIILNESNTHFDDDNDISITVPSFMTEVIAAISQSARSNPDVSQRSGVSVRVSITNHETMIANAITRALRYGYTHTAPRICDLSALMSSTAGKIELDTFDEDREPQILQQIINDGILAIFQARVPADTCDPLIDAFNKGLTIEVGEDLPDDAYENLLETNPTLKPPVSALLTNTPPDPPTIASALELTLESLYLQQQINKNGTFRRTFTKDR